jgi:tRNA (Thr-GGU) A37 N-methylase
MVKFMPYEISFKPIGIIHTPYSDKKGTPIQGCFAPESKGYIDLGPEYVDGLKDITGFSHSY